MTKSEDDWSSSNLRRRAEKLLDGEQAPPGSGEMTRLVHELQVHQLELEMQNEELRRTQQIAEEERNNYQDLFDFAPLGYVTLDEQEAIAEINLAGASLLGHERSVLIGRPFFMFMAPESRQEFEAFHRRLLMIEGRERCEALLGSNAPPRWVLLEGTAHDAGGRKGCRIALMDITERKSHEQELLLAREEADAANRAKGQFLANMSHELRTPMTGVIGMLDYVLEGELAPGLRENLEAAAGSARSLLRLLNDILDMSRIEAGKLSLEEGSFSLRECVDGVVNLLTPEARRKGIDLHLAVADDLPEYVVGDRLRLQQVLMNLVGNAVKFTEQGSVKVAVTPLSAGDGRREVAFSVTDTGIGIPADKKGLLFRMFSQTNASHTRRFGGAGLGLAISRGLADLMGGTISHTSEEGSGSTFTFTVPLAEGRAASETSKLRRERQDGGNRRILLAEDDQTTRDVIALMLRQMNFVVDAAADGRQAVEMWENGSYDLVLMDVQMPFLDGFEATRLIREKEGANGGHSPIVALTAYASKEDAGKCLEAGMDAFVAKPISFPECLETIAKLLHLRNGQAS